ncbi:hypothetical protein GJAV_G00159670 [Gymnothorax javanicus]|nr:hypothetical protein GJAV_G00159670 [Gymnothorax javanicus]
MTHPVLRLHLSESSDPAVSGGRGYNCISGFISGRRQNHRGAMESTASAKYLSPSSHSAMRGSEGSSSCLCTLSPHPLWGDHPSAALPRPLIPLLPRPGTHPSPSCRTHQPAQQPHSGGPSPGHRRSEQRGEDAGDPEAMGRLW